MANEANSLGSESEKPKKRKIPGSGRKKDLAKKARVSGHVTGEDCHCARFKCFEAVTKDEREHLISNFNMMESKDCQDAYLSMLIQVDNVGRRRPRHGETTKETKLHEKSYSYSIHVLRDGEIEIIRVCVKAFMAIFGIGHSRVRTIQTALKETGFPPRDMRGKHGNHTRKLKYEHVQRVMDHIQSFEGHTNLCSCGSPKLYLPETLNISKMYHFFKEQHPFETLSYETYRTIFKNKFNIAFGSPRPDTCTCSTTYDPFQARLNDLDLQMEALQQEKAKLISEKKLHQQLMQKYSTNELGQHSSQKHLPSISRSTASSKHVVPPSIVQYSQSGGDKVHF